MSCEQTRDLLHGYLDGEVDLVKSLEIEKHLKDCHACSESYQGIRSLQTAISHNALRFEPPANFERRLQSVLRREAGEQEQKFKMSPWRWVAVAASLVIGVVAFWAAATSFSREAAGDVLAQEIVSSHVRSLMAAHLTDVPSSDRHTVKPWFDGKLDFSPPVKDLSQQGFSLTGGRLDYIGNRPVAALVYQRRQHPINLYVWPSVEATTGQKASVHQGYNLIRWAAGGMNYWVVSDLNLAELQQFVQLLQEQDQASAAL